MRIETVLTIVGIVVAVINGWALWWLGDIRATLNRMQDRLSELTVDQESIRGVISLLRTDLTRAMDVQQDHESRLRNLENRRRGPIRGDEE